MDGDCAVVAAGGGTAAGGTVDGKLFVEWGAVVRETGAGATFRFDGEGAPVVEDVLALEEDFTALEEEDDDE